jgi:hypothetical protein
VTPAGGIPNSLTNGETAEENIGSAQPVSLRRLATNTVAAPVMSAPRRDDDTTGNRIDVLWDYPDTTFINVTITKYEIAYAAPG